MFLPWRSNGRKEKLTVRNKLAESKQCRFFLNFSLAFPPAKLRNLEKRRARARAPLLDFSDNCFLYAISRKLPGSEVCVKQDNFTQGSCSIPGSTSVLFFNALTFSCAPWAGTRRPGPAELYPSLLFARAVPRGIT